MTSKIDALSEDIGDPDYFVGRKEELEYLLQWADGAKRRLSSSMVLLARRKMGRTALLQRFFNVLYARGDPQLIPVYCRIPPRPVAKTDFARMLYQRMVTQYFAFKTRTPRLVERFSTFAELKKLAAEDRHVLDDIHAMENTLERSPGQAWGHVCEFGQRISQLNNVRILQLVDDFQYLHRWIVSDDDREIPESLFYSYMGVADSKFSPHVVTGSYFGWLEAIQGKTVGRYTERHLGSFTDEEALEAVHTWAAAYQVPITAATASYIAEACHNHPFYINTVLCDQMRDKDLTTEEGVRSALAFETIATEGDVARLWSMHFDDAMERVEGARRIVFYLAAYEPAQRTRAQIRDDLGLTMTELELELGLHRLVMAGILAYGTSRFDFQGLGDNIFAKWFQDRYVEEVEHTERRMMIDILSRRLVSAEAADGRRQTGAKIKDLPAILRQNPGATLHFDEETGLWELIEFPKDPPPDNPDDVEDTRWLNRYILASGNDSFENPDHGRYPEGILRAALECLSIGFEPDKSKWVTVSSRKKLVN